MRRLAILISAVALTLVANLAAASSRDGFKQRDFEEQYREILRQYSAGESAAVEALMEAETAIIAATGTELLVPMRKAELKVIHQVVAADSQALLPIISLHQTAYLLYRDQPSTLIPHSREMVVDLIETYARHTQSPEERALASDMMTSLAGHLQEARVDSAAGTLYRHALGLESANATALIGLSFLHEQYGQYSDAVRYLEDLIEIDPERSAAQLRLGVNLVRMGRENSGIRYLREVLEGKNPTWMRSVAYQELARLLTDKGELAQARALLEEGVKTLPDDPNLLIQLAYLAERNGSYTDDPALRLALRHSEGRDQVPSPRFVYSQLPETALAELRRDVARQVDDNLSVLAAALSHQRRAKQAREGGAR